MTDPVSRTILLLDIENYSRRDDVEQTYLRRMLYDIADRILDTAGTDPTMRRRADRGDGVIELIDANASVPAILRALISDAPVELHAVNRMASRSAQIRLRAVLATGFVGIDEHGGWVGSDLNHACRLLDADLLRRALRERPDGLALLVSPEIRNGIVRHGRPGIRAEDFHSVGVDSKNGRLTAWLYGPLPAGTAADPAAADGEADDRRASATGGAAGGGTDGAAPPAGEPATPDHGTPPPAPPSGPSIRIDGSPTFGGSFVAGNQTGVSGGRARDVHLGGTERREPR
ncbi:hypothetical protein [Streptomyces sp. 184]|uniref:hypothetical protein n=1 Tax=Streptomyces sp. 184 TaxID=1827526 RepID=UPI003892C86F